MRLSSFVPAVLALSLFSFSAEALPTPAQQDSAVALLKRGGTSPNNVLDALVKLFVDVEAKALVDACVDLTADVCANVDVKLSAKAKVLGGLIIVDADVKKLQVQAKAQVDLDIKAWIDAEVHASVIAHIDAHVIAVAHKICPVLSLTCIHDHADGIVAGVVAKIRIDIKALVLRIKANVKAKVKASLDICIPKLVVNLGVLAKAVITATIDIKAEIKARLDLWINVCVQLLASAKLIALVKALSL
ncbi:hypothetical protein BGZ74_011295 [Mortierella antarctica]|nr:hypothetical protein BGZ74_011295 [Mortierella antarctica]